MNLQKFCSKADRHTGKLDSPWSFGEFTYASNGVILIRVPRLADVGENDNAPKIHLREFPLLLSTEPAEWVSVPEVDYGGDECEVCYGTGIALLCPECEGDGEVAVRSRFNDYEDQECLTCQGNGQISRGEWASFVKMHKFKGEAIEGNCDRCDGSGMEGTQDFKTVNGVKLNEKYLWMLGELPGATLGTFGPHDAVRFRFDGGDGLVMPMRSEG